MRMELLVNDVRMPINVLYDSSLGIAEIPPGQLQNHQSYLHSSSDTISLKNNHSNTRTRIWNLNLTKVMV